MRPNFSKKTARLWTSSQVLRTPITVGPSAGAPVLGCLPRMHLELRPPTTHTPRPARARLGTQPQSGASGFMSKSRSRAMLSLSVPSRSARKGALSPRNLTVGGRTNPTPLGEALRKAESMGSPRVARVRAGSHCGAGTWQPQAPPVACWSGRDAESEEPVLRNEARQGRIATMSPESLLETQVLRPRPDPPHQTSCAADAHRWQRPGQTGREKRPSAADPNPAPSSQAAALSGQAMAPTTSLLPSGRLDREGLPSQTRQGPWSKRPWVAVA